jgi:hypothetical protein
MRPNKRLFAGLVLICFAAVSGKTLDLGYDFFFVGISLRSKNS